MATNYDDDDDVIYTQNIKAQAATAIVKVHY
jgi:hypothetical protein